MRKRDRHIMKQLIHNTVLPKFNMLRQIAAAPSPSVCFKYALDFLLGLAIRA